MKVSETSEQHEVPSQPSAEGRSAMLVPTRSDPGAGWGVDPSRVVCILPSRPPPPRLQADLPVTAQAASSHQTAGHWL